MTTENLNCPYCNASFGVPPNLTPGQRITCPRCGDSFPLRFSNSITEQAFRAPTPEMAVIAPPASTARNTTAEAAQPARRSNRFVAAGVIALMLFMAGGGLIFMLMTQQQRRGYDTSRPPRRPGKQQFVPEPETPPSVASVAPDKLAALGYLPTGVNFLFAARIPELLVSPAGVQLLRDPVQLGRRGHPLADLPNWLGFRLEDLDHLVLGARLDDAVIPPFYLVFRTLQPYDEEQLRQRLKATRVSRPGKKLLYTFHPPRPDLQLYAWFADRNTVVLALFADQLERLPEQPIEGLEQLPEELRTVLKERREAAAPVWLAGHASDWSKTSAIHFLSWMKKEDLAKLSPLKTFGVWFLPNNALVIKGVFGCKDAKGASALEAYFHTLRTPDAHFKTVQEDSWLLLQLQTEPDFLSRLSQR